MTGTPLDLTPFRSVLTGIGTLYWLFVLAVLALVLWKVKGAVPKLLGCTVVLIVLVLPIALHVWGKVQKQNEAVVKLKTATAHFEMRCRSAGEKISRAIDDVDGIFLARLRVSTGSDWSNDQYTSYDVFSAEDGANGLTGSLTINSKQGKPSPDSYILSFLKPEVIDPPVQKTVLDAYPGRYRFVEAVDPGDSQLYRYTAKLIQIKKIFPEYGDWVREIRLDRVPVSKRQARYSIDWSDLTAPGDRNFWIAGSSVRVADMRSGEVLAERHGYVMDYAQGNREGFRSPWASAKPCPNYQPDKRQTRFFVERVLHPLQGEK